MLLELSGLHDLLLKEIKFNRHLDYDGRISHIRLEEFQKIIGGVIHAVFEMLGSRDPYTAAHQQRVARLALSIANVLGFSEWRIAGVYIAGLLHDVGKVAIPSEILSKPGSISESEFEIIKDHCRLGSEILSKLEFPWPVTAAILQHHERLNGSGYPSGLRGNAIIVEARILGVADVVEAMSSHRPYRPSLGLDKALEEIKNGRGVLYDAHVVNACLKLLENNQHEFDRIMTSAEISKKLVLQPIN